MKNILNVYGIFANAMTPIIVFETPFSASQMSIEYRLSIVSPFENPIKIYGRNFDIDFDFFNKCRKFIIFVCHIVSNMRNFKKKFAILDENFSCYVETRVTKYFLEIFLMRKRQNILLKEKLQRLR